MGMPLTTFLALGGATAVAVGGGAGEPPPRPTERAGALVARSPE
jgi:hypothetical protein